MFFKKIHWKSKIKSNLWTKNFSILILGTFISMAGSNTIDMLFSLYILDLTESGLLYSTMLIIANVTTVIVPILIGSHLEKKRKERVIYLLDFASAIVFFLLGILFKFHLGHPSIILFATFLFETANAIYKVAYTSLFPALVKIENYGKAYSVDSIMTNFAECASVFAIIFYNFFKVEIILFVASGLFLIAALFETRIKPGKDVGIAEKAVINSKNTLKAYFENYRVVFRMIKETVGFKEVSICYFVDAFRTGALWALLLPFLENFYRGCTVFGCHIDQDYVYLVVLSGYGIGQFACGLFNYQLNMKGKKRLNYLIFFSFMEVLCFSFFPFFNIFGSFILMFFAGIASIMTLCVYDTGIFQRVPEEMRSRYNGVLVSVSAIFLVIGNLTGGLLIDYYKNIDFAFFLTSIPEIIILIIMMMLALPKLSLFFSFSDNELDMKI